MQLSVSMKNFEKIISWVKFDYQRTSQYTLRMRETQQTVDGTYEFPVLFDADRLLIATMSETAIELLREGQKVLLGSRTRDTISEKVDSMGLLSRAQVAPLASKYGQFLVCRVIGDNVAFFISVASVHRPQPDKFAWRTGESD